jgi:superfamily II DNA or RNA helicase
MVNVSHEELAETKTQPLPTNASIDALKRMRESLCSSSMSKDFKLQSNQRFLRRVMSPESPTRSLLMVHGTGVGKTCTAIQIAEEYIIRPEFQDKRVLVLANPSVQENFKAQIFDISRVSVDADGLLLSKQCTGRRYLDIIQRSQSESLRYTDKASQQRVMNLANKIIGEFYEFVGYQTFANMIDRQKLIAKTDNDMKKWIHETFDNRLIIIDEAHNLKETTESETNKLVAIAIEQILKNAEGVTLVLLTATPMYDTFDEIVYYINLFLWNERKLERTKMIKTSDIFTESGEFREGYEKQFRGWCQTYISFVRGENPFTFPFRLPPPDLMIALPDRTTDIKGQPIKKQRKYLTLTKSFVSPIQASAIKDLTVKAVSDSRLICVYPENKSFRETFEKSEGAYKYRGEKFLAPSKVSLYSSKFGLITRTIDATTGIVFVFSNVVESGAQLFAMCLEEHGFDPAIGNRLLKDTSGEVTRGSKGKYVLFTSDISDSDIKKALVRLKRSENADGSDIRVVIASPKVSEGVDFRNIRQIHVIDPWFNMSRIEQVLGRGMRTCSHSMLPFEEQNCTVYLHVCRYPDSEQETVDEYIYRTFVEDKAIRIAKVKRIVMESAMDCELQEPANSLPSDWRGEIRADGSQFLIPQHRNQDPTDKLIELPLSAMSAPTFEEGTYEIKCNIDPSEIDPDHERPLSAILDVKDEVLDKILKLFAKKPVWKNTDLFEHESMKQYTKSVLSYILQNAIDSGFQLKDKQGRIGHLQAKDGVFAFTVGDKDTLLDRLLVQENGVAVDLPVHVAPEPDVVEVPLTSPVDSIGFSNLSAQREAYAWPEYVKERFSNEVLEWYIADIVLSEKDKIEHMLTLNWSDPPRYAKPLLAKTSEGKNLYILGSKNIYNNAKESTTPIGLEEDAYRAWLKTSKDSFIAKRADLFASIKDGGVIFNMDEKSPDVRRAARAKNIGGRQCTTYQAGLLDKFSEWLVGSGFPEKVKTKKDRCLFLDLLVREAVVSGKEGIFWVTPEEYSIFSEDENRSDLLKRLKD